MGLGSYNWGSIYQMAASMGSRQGMNTASNAMRAAEDDEKKSRKRLEDILSGRKSLESQQRQRPSDSSKPATQKPMPSELKQRLTDYMQHYKTQQKIMNQTFGEIKKILNMPKSRDVPSPAGYLVIARYKMLKQLHTMRPMGIAFCNERLSLANYIENIGLQPTDYGISNAKDVKNELRDLEESDVPLRNNLVTVKSIIMKEMVEPLLSLRSGLVSGDVFSDTLSDGTQGPEMVVIPTGTFRMGDIEYEDIQDEDLGEWYGATMLPVHTVSINKPFAIGKYPVTFEEFDQYAHATDKTLPFDQDMGRGRRPVICVSWEDAIDYVEWLSRQTGMYYRLPTEAEWEYATRAGAETNNWWGDDATARNNDSLYECYSPPGHPQRKTCPVGSFSPNPFGLYDTVGNVKEWVQDCWHENYVGAPKNGSAWLEGNNGDCTKRVTRGNNCAMHSVDSCSRTEEFADKRHKRFDIIGLRLARDFE